MKELRPPRYAPARSLPARAFTPGRGPKPTTDVEPAAYLPAESFRDNEAYLWGIDLYNNDCAWEAHEAWEGLWRAAKHDETQAMFLQGLIQCTAARVKTNMDDAVAAQRLLERGLSRLSRVRAQEGDRYMGLELTRFLAEHELIDKRRSAPRLWLSA